MGASERLRQLRDRLYSRGGFAGEVHSADGLKTEPSFYRKPRE